MSGIRAAKATYDSDLSLIQYWVEPMFIPFTPWVTVMLPPRTASQETKKNMMTGVLLWKRAQTRKKNRREVDGMVNGYRYCIR